MASHHLFLLMLLLWQADAQTGWTVAVYEHEAYSQENKKFALPKAEAAQVVKKNMAVYREQARSAAAQNAKMIVFPENGLFGARLNRDSIAPYLEDVPPSNDRFCPSKNVFSPRYYIQHNLSQIASENHIYVIATVGDKKFCTGEWKKSCPEDGQWQFNTVVVYDPNGCLIARYHKGHEVVSSEAPFNNPPKTEFVTFKTDYGKFGVAVAYDILYKSPMIGLVEKHGVETIVYPTAWMDAMPLLSAVSFHSAWAIGMRVNLLVANRYLPSIEMSGSGIYSPLGPIMYTCRNTSESARLVVAVLPPADRHIPVVNPSPLNISLGELIRQVEAPHFTFKAWLFHDHFKFIVMRAKSGLKKVCEHQFCCYLRYEMEEYLPDELYAFGAFWGLHTFDGDYFVQVCAVVRCRLGDLHSTCGSPVSTARTKFRSIYIDGTFNSTYVFPIVLTNNMTLPEPGEVQFSKFPFPFLESKTGISRPMVAAGLFARMYEKDSTSELKPHFWCIVSGIATVIWRKFAH